MESKGALVSSVGRGAPKSGMHKLRGDQGFRTLCGACTATETGPLLILPWQCGQNVRLPHGLPGKAVYPVAKAAHRRARSAHMVGNRLDPGDQPARGDGLSAHLGGHRTHSGDQCQPLTEQPLNMGDQRADRAGQPTHGGSHRSYGVDRPEYRVEHPAHRAGPPADGAGHPVLGEARFVRHAEGLIVGA